MTRYAPGEYVSLTWNQGGDPPAHYVAGHVTDDEFRAEVARWFYGSTRKPIIPVDAKIEHVYVRTVRVANDEYGNRAHELRHCPDGRGTMAMTYWEIEPHLGVGP